MGEKKGAGQYLAEPNVESNYEQRNTATAHVQPEPYPPELHSRQAAGFYLLDMELSLGSNRDLTEMDNRFSTMTEVRRVAWPAYETTEWDEMHFLQGIAGTLELFHRSTLAFQSVVGDVTGHSVAVFQRIDQAGYKLPIDERIIADTDTLM